MGIPLQHEMDMTNPEEHVLWALVNMGERIGAPLLLPESFMREFSKHIYRCGFRHCDDKQEIYYKPPTEDATLFEGIGGEWIEANEPGVMPEMYTREEVLNKMVQALSPSDRITLFEQLGGGQSGSDSGE